MKVVVLTTEQGNQIALCNKIGAHCEITGIVLSKNIPKRPPSAMRQAQLLINRLAGRLISPEFARIWWRMQEEYQRLYHLPDVPLVRVDNVNDPLTIDTIERCEPDLIVVSGTNLVAKKVIEASSLGLGIVNLHTGISPYVKGGPNCTNWCLADRNFHLIGNTVMWLDVGIDTGSIIATEQTSLSGKETLYELHWKVMEHAHDLYCRAIGRLSQGESILSIPQDSIANGKTYYTVEWTAPAMIRARGNFHRHYKEYFLNSESLRQQTAQIRLFPIPRDIRVVAVKEKR